MMSQKSALAISSAVRRLSNTQIPVNRRVREIQLLGWKDDHDARAILMAAGDASIHLRCQAIEALGQCHGPDVRAYLEEKLQDPDARVVCAAVRALAASAGTDGAPAIVNTMQGNREREDGHGPTVRTAAVAALQKLASPNAIPALIQELGRSEEPGFDLEYGSAILAALGAASNKEARRAIAAYADRLESRTPADPLLAPHLKEKIAEARAAAQDR